MLSVEPRRQIVKAQAGEFSHSLLCRGPGLPHSSLYYQPRPPSDLVLRSALVAVALAYPRYGYRRITAELQRRRWAVSHKHVRRIMREDNLLVAVRRFCGSPINSQHPYCPIVDIPHLLIYNITNRT